MRRIGLVAWMVGLLAASVALLGGVSWPGAADPALVVMTVVRTVAGLLAVYLAAATMLAAAAALAPRGVLARLARAVTTVSLRHAVAVVVGGSLVVPTAAVAEPRPRPPAEAPVLHRVPDAAPAPSPSSPPSPPPVATGAPVPAPTRPHTVVVRPGDHLWSIAERVVAARLGRPPVDAEVIPYWLAVIDANRPQLPDPDLVFPGQELALPS